MDGNYKTIEVTYLAESNKQDLFNCGRLCRNQCTP